VCRVIGYTGFKEDCNMVENKTSNGYKKKNKFIETLKRVTLVLKE